MKSLHCLAVTVAALTYCPAAAQTADISIELQRVFKAVSGKMQSTLKEPDSAKFRDTFYVGHVGQDGLTRYSICGQINSRNSFGGYTGWQTFWGGFLGGRPEVIVGRKGLTISANDICEPERGQWARETDLSSLMTQHVVGPTASQAGK